VDFLSGFLNPVLPRDFTNKDGNNRIFIRIDIQSALSKMHKGKLVIYLTTVFSEGSTIDRKEILRNVTMQTPPRIAYISVNITEAFDMRRRQSNACTCLAAPVTRIVQLL